MPESSALSRLRQRIFLRFVTARTLFYLPFAVWQLEREKSHAFPTSLAYSHLECALDFEIALTPKLCAIARILKLSSRLQVVVEPTHCIRNSFSAHARPNENRSMRQLLNAFQTPCWRVPVSQSFCTFYLMTMAKVRMACNWPSRLLMNGHDKWSSLLISS